jgi:hypothetical protein
MTQQARLGRPLSASADGAGGAAATWQPARALLSFMQAASKALLKLIEESAAPSDAKPRGQRALDPNAPAAVAHQSSQREREQGSRGRAPLSRRFTKSSPSSRQRPPWCQSAGVRLCRRRNRRGRANPQPHEALPRRWCFSMPAAAHLARGRGSPRVGHSASALLGEAALSEAPRDTRLQQCRQIVGSDAAVRPEPR